MKLVLAVLFGLELTNFACGENEVSIDIDTDYDKELSNGISRELLNGGVYDYSNPNINYCPRECSDSHCDCDETDRYGNPTGDFDSNCQVCHSHGCSQCKGTNGEYFKLGNDYPCESCRDVFPGCIQCHDNQGCGQCENGYERKKDYYTCGEPVYYCQRNSVPSPTTATTTRRPTPYPTSSTRRPTPYPTRNTPRPTPRPTTRRPTPYPTFGVCSDEASVGISNINGCNDFPNELRNFIQGSYQLDCSCSSNPSICNCFEKNYEGAIWYSKNNNDIFNSEIKISGRYLVIDAKYNGYDVTLMYLYTKENGVTIWSIDSQSFSCNGGERATVEIWFNFNNDENCGIECEDINRNNKLEFLDCYPKAMTKDPTRRPTPYPTRSTPRPTTRPTSRQTTDRPTLRPTDRPTERPTPRPTTRPTPRPTNRPTPRPTDRPTPRPTDRPTNRPTPSPTDRPTPIPTDRPTPRPTNRPTPRPTDRPTPRPTDRPTPRPTNRPTSRPTGRPTPRPTRRPTGRPTPRPTPRPTNRPTPRPTDRPTPRPTDRPTPRPTDRPTPRPTRKPTDRPTARPTPRPTPRPTSKPTEWDRNSDDSDSSSDSKNSNDSKGSKKSKDSKKDSKKSNSKSSKGSKSGSKRDKDSSSRPSWKSWS